MRQRKLKWFYQNTTDKFIFFIFIAYGHEPSSITQVIYFNLITILGAPRMCNHRDTKNKVWTEERGPANSILFYTIERENSLEHIESIELIMY